MFAGVGLLTAAIWWLVTVSLSALTLLQAIQVFDAGLFSKSKLCKANPPVGKNYNKPHVSVPGVYDGQARFSCLFCGQWLEPVRQREEAVCS